VGISSKVQSLGGLYGEQMTENDLAYRNGKRLDRYLRRTSFWLKMGILGAHYYEDTCILAITGDGFTQLDFKCKGALLTVHRIPNSDILPTQLLLSIGENMTFQNLMDRFKLLRRMNDLAFARFNKWDYTKS